MLCILPSTRNSLKRQEQVVRQLELLLKASSLEHSKYIFTQGVFYCAHAVSVGTKGVFSRLQTAGPERARSANKVRAPVGTVRTMFPVTTVDLPIRGRSRSTCGWLPDVQRSFQRIAYPHQMPHSWRTPLPRLRHRQSRKGREFLLRDCHARPQPTERPYLLPYYAKRRGTGAATCSSSQAKPGRVHGCSVRH